MDIEKPTQRKTVQWNAGEIMANVVDQHKDFRKKVLQFETKKSQMRDDAEEDSCSDEESMEGKSQKTIEMEMNLKKAKINRISLNPQAPINLKEINRRISVKENIIPMQEEEQMDEDMMEKKAEFQKKRAQMCNQTFPMKKNH